jgi:hypothetical protein
VERARRAGDACVMTLVSLLTRMLMGKNVLFGAGVEVISTAMQLQSVDRVAERAEDERVYDRPPRWGRRFRLAFALLVILLVGGFGDGRQTGGTSWRGRWQRIERRGSRSR